MSFRDEKNITVYADEIDKKLAQICFKLEQLIQQINKCDTKDDIKAKKLCDSKHAIADDLGTLNPRVMDAKQTLRYLLSDLNVMIEKHELKE